MKPLTVALNEFSFGKDEFAMALGQIDDPAVKPLIVAWNDRYNSYFGKEAIARALGQIDDPAAMEALLASTKSRQIVVRLAAFNVLEQTGDPRAVDAIIATLSDEDYKMRSVAAEALIQIGLLPWRR